MARLAPLGIFREFTNDGDPLNGGKLYTYESGTSTPKPTYTDATESTQNANPVELDANGRANVWLGTGSYRFILKTSADVTLWGPVDNITGETTSAFGGQVEDVSGNLAVTEAYENFLLNCTATLTLSLLDAATAEEGFYFIVKNSGTGLVTIDPDGSETIDGAATITVRPGESATIICDGSNWLSVFNAISTIPFVHASAASAAYQDFAEDTDNGTNRVRLIAPSLLAADADVTLPEAAGTLALTSQLSLPCDGRLTLTTGVPVTTGDVTAATNIYFTPYRGDKIAVYNGTSWQVNTFSELTLALGTLTSGLPYDVFYDYNSGTPQLAMTAWTNSTTRATALAYQNGILVQSGTATKRYLGTFYTTSTTTTEDSATKRFLWNNYNRVARHFLRRESTSSWTYTTATVRQANANTANQIDFIRGLDEDAISVNLVVEGENGASNTIAAGIGLDSTSAMNIGQGAKILGGAGTMNINYHGLPGLGRHYIAWLETSTAASTSTWYGNRTLAGTTIYSGLSGAMMA